MKLYQSNAKDPVGKETDCKIRRPGCYPMTVVEINGELYVKDAVDACMSIPEKETDSNCYWFNLVID